MQYFDYFVMGVNTLVLLFLAFQDIKYKQVNIIIIMIYGLLTMVLSLLGSNDWMTVAAGIIPGILLIGLAIISRGKIGVGDGILVLAIGLNMGIRLVFGTLLVALLLSALTGGILMILKKANRKTELPFVPFLFSGYIVCEIINITAV